MKKSQVLSLFFINIVLALSLSGQSMAKGPEYTLSLNLFVPPIHTRYVEAIKPWVDEIEKRSGGRLKVEPYFAEALSKMADTYQSVKTGLADISETLFTTSMGSFPFFDEFFMIAKPSLVLSKPGPMLQKALTTIPKARNELQGAKLLFIHTPIIGQVLATKKPIQSLNGLSGMKINIMGGALAAQRLQGIGINTVSMPMADVLMALQQGVIDGTILGPEILVSRGWGKYLSSLILLTTGGSIFGFAMNQQVYDRLPPELRKVIDEVSGEFADNLFEKYWENAQVGNTKKWMETMGGKWVLLSDDDYAKADAAMGTVEKLFVERMGKHGYDGKGLLKTIRDLESKYSVSWQEFSRSFL
ncbi:MAG: TRAP transporter substrate-binding protein DctP [Deltaproteobacteria bacterium]|nr:TRAP transporter substrate-binding protein DctP [Deltaproteobacteria bacterium]